MRATATRRDDRHQRPAVGYDIAALRRENPILDVVASYGVELRQVGRAFVGRCPFHTDRGRPNLYVYPASASWYCYRCAVGGDVIEFVRRREATDFLGACARLARGNGAPLRPAGLAPALLPAVPAPAAAAAPVTRAERRWDCLTIEEQTVMNLAGAFYHRALWRTPGALAYLRRRGIPAWVLRACRIGYCDGRSLEAHLRHHSDPGTAVELGLLRAPPHGGDGRPLREFLSGRIVVPELRYGQCIWLIGRAIGDDARRAKYLGLGGERPVLGLERAAGRREAFLCEGVLDYLTAVAWGLPAFSPCGTAAPAERLGFLARASVVYGVLDGDDAGRAAAERFGGQLGSRFRALRLPDGCDLNDLGQRPGGRVAFFSRLAAARDRRGDAPGAGLADGNPDGGPPGGDGAARRAKRKGGEDASGA